MRRLWLVDEFGHGGIGRYAVDVANHLGDVAGTVVATSALGPVEGLRGTPAVEWFPRPAETTVGKAVGGGVGLLRAARSVSRGDVAWIPLGIRPTFELVLTSVLRARGARVVVTVHNRGPHGRGESPLVVRAARLATAVVVHTDALERWARDHDLAAVRLPFPPPDVQGQDQTVTRESLGVPPGVVLVSLLGYLHEYKGVDVLVEALALARRREPQLGLHVLLAGRVPESGAVPLALAAAEHLPGLTVRPGWLAEAELASLLELSDLVALPYRDIDNSGSGALARSRGLPALASDLPGLREIFGEAATYVPPGDVTALADALVGLPALLPRLTELAARSTPVDLPAAYQAFVRSLDSVSGS